VAAGAEECVGASAGEPGDMPAGAWSADLRGAAARDLRWRRRRCRCRPRRDCAVRAVVDEVSCGGGDNSVELRRKKRCEQRAKE
jgi:hypothetical protein